AAAGLITRAELVGKIAELTGDVVEGANYAFENAKEKLMFLNPNFNFVTKGMHVNGMVEGGRIVIPPGFE
ncbi:hypothetical protein A2U01_0112400, partial [Trifolium medium]|nr:hypothetical protein [Trifolium medium]